MIDSPPVETTANESPPKAKTDWEFARALFIGGMSCREIATKLGLKDFTVERQAQRGQWGKLRRAHITNQVTHTRIAKLVVPSVWTGDTQEQKRWPQRIWEQASRGLDAIANFPPTQIVALADALDKIDRIGRRALGLDHEQAGNAFLAGVSMGASMSDLVSQSVTAQKQAQVVEVKDVPPEAPAN